MTKEEFISKFSDKDKIEIAEKYKILINSHQKMEITWESHRNHIGGLKYEARRN